MKKYTKAKVIAKNNPQGSYAAGCPEKNANGGAGPQCKSCERSK